MLIKGIIFGLVLLIGVNRAVARGCPRYKRTNITSQTKCVAGRRFFARLDRMPTFNSLFPKEKLVQPYFFPWLAMVSAFYAGNTLTCTGTLINDRYIITAQHCVLPPIKSQHVTISLGSQQLIESRQKYFIRTPSFVQYQAKDIILHPNFNYAYVQSSANDLALIKTSPVVYTKTIYPIQLPNNADKYHDLSDLMAESVGWEIGKNRYSRKIFYKSTIRIISNRNCSNYNLFYRRGVNSNLLCTIGAERNYKEFCNAVAGAPLMIENYKRIYNVTVLVGVASWSLSNGNCLRNRNPIVYIRIDKKLDWIRANTVDALYCRY